MQPTATPIECAEGQFIVTGSYGELLVDSISGVVLQHYNEPGEVVEYADIELFDVSEFRSTYGEVHDTDILLIGYWDNVGVYTPPDEDFRQAIKGQHTLVMSADVSAMFSA